MFQSINITLKLLTKLNNAGKKFKNILILVENYFK